MRHIEWLLLQFALMWHVMKIIKTHGELLSKENIFELQKYPAVSRNAEMIKNTRKICYDNSDAYDGSAYSNNSSGSTNTSEIFNIFESILQYFHKIECRRNEEHNGLQDRMTPAIEHHHRQIEEPAEVENQYAMQEFNILQQLKLDEQKEKWQEQQKLQQQQQENALKLQQLAEMQQIMQHLQTQSLGKAGKTKKKNKRKKKKKPNDKRKKRKKKKPSIYGTPLLTQPAHILYASPTQKPHQYYDDHYPHKITSTTTKKPYLQHELVPLKKIKYILRKNTIFKKKKKEYLNHLKQVIYPFVKFIAFFTVINPFTLAVSLFSLISPVIFGFLGFVALSFLIKPALHLLFGVKHTVNSIKRQKWLAQRRRQRLRDSRRPITIHKHYYQQRPIVPSKKHHSHHHHHRPPPSNNHYPKIAHPYTQHQFPRPLPHGNEYRPRQVKLFNPLLPGEKDKLKKDTHFLNDFEDYKETFHV